MMDDAAPGTADYGRVRARSGVKWARHGPDVLAAWVADMDFDPPPAVQQAIGALVDDGDLGYNLVGNELAPAYADFQLRHHGWQPDVDLIRPFTTVLHAIETVLWHHTEPGDGVVVFTPIYYPFLKAIEESGRRRVDVELDREGWRIDPERLEAAIDPTTRVILFCQPHNPTGRIFEAGELAAVADVAERHDLLVVTDEIWGDITYDGPHRPLATSDERFTGRLVTLGSASKSFNLAGLRCAVAHIDHQPLWDVFSTMPGHLFGASSTLGIAGTVAAWTDADAWLEETRLALGARRDQLVRTVAADLPGVRLDPPEATYLAWLEFTAAGLGDDPAVPLLDDARVALSHGPMFGPTGVGFARLNFATGEQILDDIIDRIAEYLAGRSG
jgi:cystathionine beta-lyase